MNRASQISALRERIAKIGFTPGESRGVAAILSEGKTHRQAAEERGITRAAHKQLVRRARKRARQRGVEIPAPRRSLASMCYAALHHRCAAI